MEHAVSGRKYLPRFLKNIYIFFTRLFLKGLDSSNNIDSRINITTLFNFPDGTSVFFVCFSSKFANIIASVCTGLNQLH